MKKLLLLFFIVLPFIFHAQVGIGTPTPKAQLEIKSSSETTPTITDGLIIPKVNNFPATNPTIDQQGMLVYLKNVSGTNQPGFYYWDFATLLWKPIAGATASGTLDQAYDSGGAGLGKTITADAGAVLINGTDGLVSTGTLGSGAIAPSGPGVKMFWNPRKAAFRAGRVTSAEWDDATIGANSASFGFGTTASGTSSFAWGSSTIASGIRATAFGFSTEASGQMSTAFGNTTIAAGNFSTAFGSFSSADGIASTAFGSNNFAKSYGETVLGLGATDYTTSTNGATQFRTANATDRLFVVGNAIDTNNNNIVDTAERSDAFVILKNGATGIGTALPNASLDVNASDKGILIPRVALSSILLQAPITNPQGGALVNGTMVYNTETAGTAPNNVKSGFYYWNTNKWIRLDTNGENNSKYYSSVGSTSVVMTNYSTPMPDMNVSFVPNDDLAIMNFSANGYFDLGQNSCNVGNNVIYFQIRVNGLIYKTLHTPLRNYAIISANIHWNANFQMVIPVTKGIMQTISISWFLPNCTNFINLGNTLGDTHSRTLIIIDPNGGGGIVGTAPPVANLWQENGNSGTNPLLNFVGTTDNNDLIFRRNNTRSGLLGLSNTSFGVAALLNNTTGMYNTAHGIRALTGNTTGMHNTAHGSDALFNNITGSSNTSLGFASNVDFTNLNNATAIGARAMVGASNSLVLGSINGVNGATADVNVGIGTTTPDRKLEVSGTGDQFARITTTGTANVGMDFKRSGIGSDWQIRNDAGLLLIGQSGDDLATVTDIIRVGGGSFTPATDNSTVLGQSTRRWTAVHAVNGVIQTSDANDKKQMLPLTQGLDKIKSLRPISFQWKDDTIDKSSTHLGFVAQEVQQVLPEIVVDHEWKEIPDTTEKVWEKTERLGMKYAEIIPVLVKAMQEQQVIIDEMKEENKLLKSQVEAQEKTTVEIIERLKSLESK